MSARARRVAGFGDGALAGQHPDIAFGVPHVAGAFLADDFDNGWAEWTQTSIGAAPTWSQQAPGGWTEIGVGQLATAASANSGGVALRSTVASCYRVPPPGSIWAAKLRMTVGTTGYTLWSGFASAAAAVGTADATQFVGVRSVGGNLFGVVKNGAASETTVDYGLDCEGSTWRVVGFEVDGTTTTPTVQFMLLRPSSRGGWQREDIGSPISTTMPSTTLFPCALGLTTQAISVRTAQVDLWNWGGRVPRLT